MRGRIQFRVIVSTALLSLALLAGCSEAPVDEPAAEVTTTAAAPEPTIDHSVELRKTAPSGDWTLTKLTGDTFGKDYGYWYLEDETFKAGQGLLKVPSIDVKFVVDDCTSEHCIGHIDPGAGTETSEPEGHLYPWAGEGQKHSFTWDGKDVALATTAEETNGVCFDTATGEDLPNTSWTDNATYKYSDVTIKRGSDKAVAAIDAQYRVDYETVFIPDCEGPTTMFLEGAIAFEKADAAK